MKKVFITFVSAIFFMSCTALMGVNYNAKMKEAQLGMTKEAVMQLLGNDYKIVSAKDTGEGMETALRFPSDRSYGYVLYFLDNKLVEWHEYISPQPTVQVVKENPK